MGEFNVNKTTGGLDPTAGMPETYPAEQVMMSDGVTSVEDALDSIINAGAISTVSLSLGESYTMPSDGVVRILFSDSTEKVGGVEIYDETNGSWKSLIAAKGSSITFGSTCYSTYARKGHTVRWHPSSTNASASVVLYN